MLSADLACLPACAPPPPTCAVLCQWEEALNHFKSELSSGRDVFGPLIHKYLLDNKHRYGLGLAYVGLYLYLSL